MDVRETPQTTREPLSEYSHHGRDWRFADGRAVVVLAALSFVAVAAAAAALGVIIEVWR